VQTTLVNPTDAEALYVLGQVYLALDQRDSAVLVLEKAVALDPGDESYAQALASARRGR
jgi:cytochrome c-type biogenesis protein CcmH/NrfG